MYRGSKYLELHARSAFSFLEGASLPEDLVDRAAELGMPAVALLDRDVLAGAPRFHLAAEKKGVRGLIGAEITCDDGTRLSLLAASRAGYQNLCRLITRIKMRAPKGEHGAGWDDLEEFAAGIVCLTGGSEGPLHRAVGESPEAVRHLLDRLLSIYGRGRVYAELQRHFDRSQEAVNQRIIEAARSAGLPLLATNGVNHARIEQRNLQDVFTCLRHKTTVAEAGRLLARNAEHYLKHPEDMAAVFGDIPEAVANTAALGQQVDFTLANLGYEFPRYPAPPGETMDSLLRKLTLQGARERYRPLRAPARQQIEKELALIEKLNLAGYFLIVWDIVRFCKENGILAQGRGSAANSAVCYSLGITAVDPVGMDLLFERFLSEERGEWPDIDIDLPSGDQREQAIQYIYERYGKLGAAMTANVITYREKSAARDIGKALGFGASDLDHLSKMITAYSWEDPEDTPERRFKLAGLDPAANPLVARFLTLFHEVQDLPRHLGQHSGGMIVCQGQLDSIVPLEPATMPGRVIVQWDKEDCADMGIIKVDLLGLGMMAVVKDSLELIRDHYGENVDLARIPKDDPAVYAALQRADTIGMFQVESRAQMSCLPRLKPKCFYDIVVEVAIIRPGPIVGKMVHPYLRRREGAEPVHYAHPSLEPVLKRTLGVPLFQEQLLRMAMAVAGFSGGEAEELRRAFGFKRSEKRMKEIEVKLRAGMTRNRIGEEAQDEIVRSITSFALYGFPESHAASFALIAYASAYLKCHYLAAFTCALLNNQPMGFYHPSTIIKDAQRHGLHFLPVDVTSSDVNCTVEENRHQPPTTDYRLLPGPAPQGNRNKTAATSHGPFAVRLGFNYVKGLRASVAEAIAAERRRAPFGSIQDLVQRVSGLRKNEVSILAAAGALNSLQPDHKAHRRAALWDGDLAARPAGPLHAGQDNADQPSPLRPMDREQRLVADFVHTGLSIGPHPMRLYREQMKAQHVRTAAELSQLRNGMTVRVAGAVITRQRPGTAKGFVFLSLEDETGVANVIIEPDFFARHRAVIVENAFLLIDGVLQNQEGVIHVRAGRVQPLRLNARAADSHDFH